MYMDQIHISFLRAASCAGANHLHALVFKSYVRTRMLFIRAIYARILRVYAPVASACICLFDDYAYMAGWRERTF